jgi:hypothetical protein
LKSCAAANPQTDIFAGHLSLPYKERPQYRGGGISMARTTSFLRAAAIALLIGAVEVSGALAVTVGLSDSAFAQTRGRGGGGFFDSLFGPRRYGPIERDVPMEAPVESSRAPAPKKADPNAPMPTLSVMVMGDSMADWLGYGLEEAFADSPEIGVVRKPKAHSGLIRYEARSDLDWWHVARDLLGKEKVDYVVMMLGVDDRTSIRESQVEQKKQQEAKEAKEAAKEPPKDDKDGKAEPDKQAKVDDEDETPSIVAPEPKRGASGVIEFRTERWEQIYTKRIDDTIAALKSKGVPVLWVGLPSIRGTRSTADVVYLNDLYRARAEKAGIVYVDVWDGFVDEGGKFTYMGPDFEGQNRRLRSGDGVHFTKSGARKLAHYVERELRRYMQNRALPLAMPAGAPQLQGAPNEPAARPVAGPVQALTGVATNNEELLGGGATRPVHSDPTATRVLVKGETVAPESGRADDFKWPRGGGDAATAEPLTPTAAAARAAPVAPQKPVAGKDSKQAAREPPKAASKESNKDANKREQAAEKPKTAKPAVTAAERPRTSNQPRPPQPVQQRREPGLFGLFR